MEFERWVTPFEKGEIWLVDLSWGVKDWTLEKEGGLKYSISGENKHEHNDLIARVFHVDSEMLYEVAYKVVSGFRCLDEHGLTEIWNSDDYPALNTIKLKEHGWHKESPLTFFMGNDGEWSHLLITKDECVEVICKSPPHVKEVRKVLPSTSNT
jgi:hypothetical protein